MLIAPAMTDQPRPRLRRLARRDARRLARGGAGRRRTAPSSTSSPSPSPAPPSRSTRRVFETVRAWGDGPSTAIGQGARLPAPWAALVNGTAAHALDFDDNFDPAKAHATAVLVPAILALAEQEGASGRACLDAYVAGLQILGRVGQGVNPAHRNRGWHATATVGAIGAAAACARLLRLDAAKGRLRGLDRDQHGGAASWRSSAP